PGRALEPQPAAHRACRGGLTAAGTGGPGGREAGAGSAALAAERPTAPGRAVGAVDLPGVLAPVGAGGVRLLGALALQRLADLPFRLVLGTGPARGAGPVLGAFRLRRRVSHTGLLPPCGYVPASHTPVPAGPPAIPCSEGDERQAHAG